MNFSKLKDNQLRGKYVSLLSTDGERCVKRISTITPNEILLKGRCTISRESTKNNLFCFDKEIERTINTQKQRRF